MPQPIRITIWAETGRRPFETDAISCTPRKGKAEAIELTVRNDGFELRGNDWRAIVAGGVAAIRPAKDNAFYAPYWKRFGQAGAGFYEFCETLSRGEPCRIKERLDTLLQCARRPGNGGLIGEARAQLGAASAEVFPAEGPVALPDVRLSLTARVNGSEIKIEIFPKKREDGKTLAVALSAISHHAPVHTTLYINRRGEIFERGHYEGNDLVLINPLPPRSLHPLLDSLDAVHYDLAEKKDGTPLTPAEKAAVAQIVDRIVRTPRPAWAKEE